MPGLVPGIHVLISCGWKDVDGRDKPGHDERKKQLMLPSVWPPTMSGPQGC
jgi:hypothetical protein